MKKVIVFSDTHGNVDNIINLINKKYDYYIFLGDYVRDVKKHNNILVVKGNCDFNSTEKYYDNITIENVKIGFTHGHLYNVKQDLYKLINFAKKENVNIMCYGHTHKSKVEFIDGIWFVNPGALSKVRGGNNSFAEIIIDNNKVKINIINNAF